MRILAMKNDNCIFLKNPLIDFQLFTEKMQFYSKKLAEKFGGMKKKQ